MLFLFDACHLHHPPNPQNYYKNVNIFLLWKSQGTSYTKKHTQKSFNLKQTKSKWYHFTALMSHIQYAISRQCCHQSKTIQSSHFTVTPRHISLRFLLWSKSRGSLVSLRLRSTKWVDTYSVISTPITTLMLSVTEIKMHKSGTDIFLRTWWKFSWQSVQNMLHNTVDALVTIINARFSRWLLQVQLTEVM
jgi:hypothetical protein